MAYDEDLDKRIKNIVSKWRNTDSKKMFGGVCHLMNGNMFSGVHKDRLILRLGEGAAETAMLSSNVGPFDITGRPMKGWVMVEENGCSSDEELKAWLDQARDFAETLKPK